MRHCWIALAAITAAGCVSVPDVRWHTLDMRPSGQVAIDRQVVFPEMFESATALRRANILIRTQPTEVEYYATREWVEPVAELVTRKLAAEFGTQGLQAGDLYVEGTILAFEQVDVPGGAEAHIQLALRVSGNRREVPLLEMLYDVSEPAASSTPGDVVAALSHALATIAARLARDIAEAAP